MGEIIEYHYGDKKYPYGVINDVATIPGYGGKGIGKKLLNMAFSYFQEQNADFSCLAADPNDFPRSKLYIPHGYYDLSRVFFGICFSNYINLFKNLPLMLPFLPAISQFQIPYVLSLIKNRNLFMNEKEREKSAKNLLKKRKYIIEIKPNHCTEEFRESVNTVNLQQYCGYHPYTKEEWNWARNKSSSKMYQHSQISIREADSGQIIAGSVLNSYNQYATSLGFKIKMGLIKNLFVNNAFIKDQVKKSQLMDQRSKIWKKTIELYKLIFMATLKISINRKNSVSMILLAEKDKIAQWASSKMGFFGIMAGTHMVKEMKTGLKHPSIEKKPFYIDPAEDFMSW